MFVASMQEAASFLFKQQRFKKIEPKLFFDNAAFLDEVPYLLIKSYMGLTAANSTSKN